MPILKAANNAKTTLAQNINSSVTSFSVADGSGFPADGPFMVTIDDEIMLVRARSGNTLSSILRGQEGTTAAAHSSGAEVENRFTAGTYESLRQYIDEGEDPDWAGVKYRLVMINGEAFMKVVEA